MKRVVAAVQVVALAAAVLFVVLLFANEPARPAGGAATPGGGGAPAAEGSGIFATYCSGCHGASGGGGVGPQLSGGKVASALTRDVEIGVVTDGFGGMPAWKDRLSPDQIQAVVDYTRTL